MKRKSHRAKEQKVSPLSGDLELIEPDAAAIDVGSRSHWVAVNPQREANPVREFGTFTADLISLVDWLAQCGAKSVYLSEEKAREFQRQHSEDILQPAIEMAQMAGVRFTSDILVGNIAKVISHRAEEIGCDSIVMGTHGMGAIANLLMGSVATKVIHLTHLPVTLVK